MAQFCDSGCLHGTFDWSGTGPNITARCSSAPVFVCNTPQDGKCKQAPAGTQGSFDNQEECEASSTCKAPVGRAWVLCKTSGVSCDSCCSKLGKTCKDGSWSVSSRSSLDKMLDAFGLSSSCPSKSAGGAKYNPCLEGSTCYWGGGDSRCSHSGGGNVRLFCPCE